MNDKVSSSTGPFAMVPEWLLYSDVSHGAVRLWATLQRHDGEKGCIPSRARLASLLQCSDRTIDGYLKELVEAKALSVEHRTTSRGQTSSQYYLTPAKPASHPGAKSASGDGAKHTSGDGAKPASHGTRARENERDMEPDQSSFLPSEGSHSVVEEPKAKRITNDFLQRMRDANPDIDIDAELEKAMNHTAYKKAIDKRRYFQTWVRNARKFKRGQRREESQRSSGDGWGDIQPDLVVGD